MALRSDLTTDSQAPIACSSSPSERISRRFRLRLTAMLTSSLMILATAGQAVAALVCGDEGPEVTALQDCLRSAGYFRQDSTGYFGTITEDAVTAFQRDRGLEVDGIAGDATLSALGCDGRFAQVNYDRDPYRYSDQYRPVNTQGVGSFSGTSADSSSRKRYVVIVPTTKPARLTTLGAVRRYFPEAFQVDSPLGSYVQAASSSNRNIAESRSRYLRGFGLDAQVRYF